VLPMSTASKRRLLIVEDDPSIARDLREVLESEGYEVAVATAGDTGLALATKGNADLVLTDLRLPGLGGLELVRQLHAARPQLPIILTTAHGTTQTAIEATKSGAYDYLLKPFEMPELLALVEKALASARLTGETLDIGGGEDSPNAIVGQSRAMQSIYKEIGRIAAMPVPVLIRGDTGTGKELIARAIFQNSDRAKAPFVAVNCAAIPETLLESELFGHERGAFTGAVERRIGRFEQATGGTLFLDEIGELAMNTQAKLLRVLQQGVIQRLGGREEIPVNVRVLAATHRDLETGMAEKEFREDLYYRLAVVTLRLPRLGERREDIPSLVGYFLRRHGAAFGIAKPSIHADALALLGAHEWPGNVREIENCIRKLLLDARGYSISAEQVSAALASAPGAAVVAASAGTLGALAGELLARASRGEIEGAHAALLEAAERELFAQAVALTHGNQAKAARWLGISRLTLREKLQRYGLHPNAGAEGDVSG
jgi:nitrogen regulation protein NR(I)